MCNILHLLLCNLTLFLNSTASALIRKYCLAVEGEHITREALIKLSASVRQEWIDEWTAAETVALRLRGDQLMIYDVNEHKGNEQLQN